MSKYRGPKLRIIRRLGKLPGLTNKMSKKTKAPGVNGTAIKIRRKRSQYGRRLKEKQKLRFHYGITERQLINYIKKARKKKGPSGTMLLTLLEMRLDTIVYHLGFAPSIPAARQLINHGHIYLNDQIVTIPSFICKPKNIIKIKANTASEKLVRENIERNMRLMPPHLSVNREKLEGKIYSLVNRKVVSVLINELLVIEYYSRKI